MSKRRTRKQVPTYVGSGRGEVGHPSHTPKEFFPATPGEHSWRKGDVLALVAVLVVALTVRAAYIYGQRLAPDFDHPVVDAAFYHQWAAAFADGQRFEDHAYYRAPLYPWMLGTIYEVFGTGPLAPRVVQACLSALTCGLLFVIGRRLFGRTIGLVAALVAATYWVLVYFTGELLIPTLITFLDLLLVWLLIVGYSRPRLAIWCAAGFVLGLTGIARPNVLLFAPAAVAWMVAFRPNLRRKMVAGAAVFAAGCLIPVLPITVRNYVVAHDFVFISSQGGVNLYIGNNPRANGFEVVLPGARRGWHSTRLDQAAMAEKAEGRSLKASEVSNYFLRETAKFVFNQPGSAVGLLFRKLGYFWNGYEFTNNKDLYNYTARYTPIIRYLPVGFGLIAPLGLLGLAVSWSRRMELFPLWGFALVYMLSVVVFFVSARFRVPILPILILYAVVGCAWLVRTAKRRRPRALVAAAMALCVLLALTNIRQRDWRRAPGSWEATVALLLARQGKVDQAIAEYRKVLALNPKNTEAYGELASLHAIKGDVDAALRSARKCIELSPDYAMGHDRLGMILANQGQIDRALVHFRRAVELLPHDAMTQQHLGQALMGQGELAEAARHLERAAKLDPNRPDTQASLRYLATQQPDAARAIERFRELLSLDPARPQIYDQWAALLRSRGRDAEAANVLREGLRHVPENVQLTAQLAWLLVGTTEPDVRDPVEAVRLSEGLCERDGRTDPYTLHVLAVAYAAAGRCDDALREARLALPLTEGAGLTPTTKRLRTLIARCAG